MKEIQAKDCRSFKAPSYKIYSVLLDVQKYKLWWPSSVKVKLLTPEKEGVGACVEIRAFGGRGFSARIESVVPSRKIVMQYYDGLYYGEGIWTLEDNREMTKVCYEVNLEIKDSFVSLLGRFANLPKLHSSLIEKIYNGLDNYLESSGRF